MEKPIETVSELISILQQYPSNTKVEMMVSKIGEVFLDENGILILY